MTTRRRITWDAYFLYGPEARWDQEPGPLVSRSSASSVIAAAGQLQVAVQPLLEGWPSPLVYARLRAWWQLHR